MAGRSNYDDQRTHGRPGSMSRGAEDDSDDASGTSSPGRGRSTSTARCAVGSGNGGQSTSRGRGRERVTSTRKACQRRNNDMSSSPRRRCSTSTIRGTEDDDEGNRSTIRRHRQESRETSSTPGVSSAVIRKATLAMLDRHGDYSKESLCAFLEERYPEIPATARKVLVVAASTAASRAAHLHEVYEKNSRSVDDEKRRFAAGAASALSFWGLGLTAVHRAANAAPRRRLVESCERDLPPPPAQQELPPAPTSSQPCPRELSAAVRMKDVLESRRLPVPMPRALIDYPANTDLLSQALSEAGMADVLARYPPYPQDAAPKTAIVQKRRTRLPSPKVDASTVSPSAGGPNDGAAAEAAVEAATADPAPDQVDSEYDPAQGSTAASEATYTPTPLAPDSAGCAKNALTRAAKVSEVVDKSTIDEGSCEMGASAMAMVHAAAVAAADAIHSLDSTSASTSRVSPAEKALMSAADAVSSMDTTPLPSMKRKRADAELDVGGRSGTPVEPALEIDLHASDFEDVEKNERAKADAAATDALNKDKDKHLGDQNRGGDKDKATTESSGQRGRPNEGREYAKVKSVVARKLGEGLAGRRGDERGNDSGRAEKTINDIGEKSDGGRMDGQRRDRQKMDGLHRSEKKIDGERSKSRAQSGSGDHRRAGPQLQVSERACNVAMSVADAAAVKRFLEDRHRTRK